MTENLPTCLVAESSPEFPKQSENIAEKSSPSKRKLEDESSQDELEVKRVKAESEQDENVTVSKNSSKLTDTVDEKLDQDKNLEKPEIKPFSTSEKATIKDDSVEIRQSADLQESSEISTIKIKSETQPGGNVQETQRAVAEVNGQPQFVKKKKVALLLAYCGEGYNGMQRNPDVKTIEDDLINALFLAGVISEDAKENSGKMSFQRSARTDKGVSAARQIVSLKMILLENVIEKINSHLPPVIRVFDYKRTTKGFDSKNSCSARTYEYLSPTFAFAPTHICTRKDYRITDDVLQKINETLQLFVGTHNYHNFTSGKKPTDPSNQRYIMKLECDKPFERDGMEFVVLRVKGQSFMLHQIRKMIGLTIAIVRNLTQKEAVDRAWENPKADIPRAPGLGLMLDQVHFDYYNKRFGKDGIHEALQWEEFEDSIKKFKDDYIYKSVIEMEKKQNSMMRWLNTLSVHTYSSAGMDQPKGFEDQVTTGGETKSSNKLEQK